MVICDVVQAWGQVSGGVKRYIGNKIDYVADREDLAHLLIIPGNEDRCRQEKQTRIYEVASPVIPGSKGYRMLLDRPQILKIIATESPNLIEVANAYYPAWISIEAGRSEKIPVIGFYHSDFPRAISTKLPAGTLKSFGLHDLVTDTVETYLANLYNQMSATITATQRFKTLLERIGVNKVFHIPLGTDTAVFKPKQSRGKILSRLGLAPETFLILYAGRFAGMKNIPNLMVMMEKLAESREKIHLVLMGDGEQKHLVKKAAANRTDVTLLPFCTKPERLADFYSAADLFVNPGTRETFGLVSVEAQACGTRVLAVKGGGMDETVEDESPLIMAQSEDPAHLARAVQKIIDLREGPEDRKQRRQRILNRFSIKRNMDGLFELYQQLAHSPT